MNYFTNRFLDSCRFNNLNEVIRIVNGDFSLYERIFHHPLNRDYYKDGFIIACKMGYFDLAKWLFDNYYFKDITPEDINKAFELSFIGGNEKLCKWLHKLGNNENTFNYDQAFINACNYNHTELAKWLYFENSKQYSIKVLDEAFNNIKLYHKELSIDEFINSDNYYLVNDNIKYKRFNLPLIKIDVELIKFLYSLRKNNDSKDFKEKNYNKFIELCCYNNTEVCQWLYSNDKYDDLKIYKSLIDYLKDPNSIEEKALNFIKILSSLDINFDKINDYIIINFPNDFYDINSYPHYGCNKSKDLDVYYNFVYLLLEKGINFEKNRDFIKTPNIYFKYITVHNRLKRSGRQRIKVYEELFCTSLNIQKIDISSD